MKDNEPWYKKLGIWIGIVASICTILTYIQNFEIMNKWIHDLIGEPVQIILNPRPSDEELEKSIQLIKNEIEELNTQLSDLCNSKEYTVKNGLDPTKDLNYYDLITSMEDISQYFYFVDIIEFMKESGYEIEDRTMRDLMNQFFDLQYEEQVNIMSKMFVYTSSYEYKVAKDYVYDIDDEGNIKAEATEVENISIPIFICKELKENPFELIRITKKNKNIYYTISYDG